MIITRNNKLGGPSMALPDYLYDFDKMDKIPIRVWGIIYLIALIPPLPHLLKEIFIGILSILSKSYK